MMMEAAPAAASEMVQPELVFELLVVALDPPAQLGEVDEIGEGRRCRQGREPAALVLGKPVSSTIHAGTGPCRTIGASAHSRVTCGTAAGSHGASAMK
jgi:hypothetical protein